MAQPIKYPTLSESLMSARGKKSMRRISQEASIDYGHVNRVFHGQSHPSREILLRICRVLNVTPEKIAEIFDAADYRAPAPDELDEEPAA